mmetsp:Transcript_4572/g.13148  ORF Transcript_4572/g.13148 Transcript_4572/m.13148 type:complete len:343 (-) Transcript_4572:868-1896(-)
MKHFSQLVCWDRLLSVLVFLVFLLFGLAVFLLFLFLLVLLGFSALLILLPVTFQDRQCLADRRHATPFRGAGTLAAPGGLGAMSGRRRWQGLASPGSWSRWWRRQGQLARFVVHQIVPLALHELCVAPSEVAPVNDSARLDLSCRRPQGGTPATVAAALPAGAVLQEVGVKVRAVPLIHQLDAAPNLGAPFIRHHLDHFDLHCLPSHYHTAQRRHLLLVTVLPAHRQMVADLRGVHQAPLAEAREAHENAEGRHPLNRRRVNGAHLRRLVTLRTAVRRPGGSGARRVQISAGLLIHDRHGAAHLDATPSSVHHLRHLHHHLRMAWCKVLKAFHPCLIVIITR